MSFYQYDNNLDHFFYFVLLYRGFYTKRLLIKTRSRLKSEHYVEAEIIPEDNSHYQELGVPGGGNPYLNTTIK